MPERTPPAGKSGPRIGPVSGLYRSMSSAFGLSMRTVSASTTSERLWGGMFVAMPTADPPRDGLEAVPGVGQRAPDDHGHRVVDVRPVELLLDRLGDDAAVRLLGLLGHRPPRCPGSRLPSRAPGCIAPGPRRLRP